MRSSPTVLTVLFGTIFGVFGASLSKSLLNQAPDECRWADYGDEDLTLVCRLRTINSELENTNFSVLHPENTVRLRLHCNDGLFFQSSLNHGSFKQLAKLRSLTIEYCKIANLSEGSFRGLKGLTNLTLRTHNTDWSSISLNVAPLVFNSELANLQRLDLSENNMWSIPDGMICPLPKLDYLNLTQNRLRDLSAFHFSASLSTRLSKQCGSTIATLDLSHNTIDNLPPAIFSGLRQLTDLRLQSNGLNFIADRALEGLVSLARLDISLNRLTNLPPELFSEAKHIKEIYLQNNSLNVLAPGIFTDLQQLLLLDLSGNELTSEWINSATFRGLTRLIVLDLSGNKISKMESTIFRDLKALQALRLQNNFIESIAEHTFAELGALHSLVLSNNRLSTIEHYTFGGLHNLALLSLDYNRISRIDRKALRNQSKLQELHINGNKLLEVPYALYDVPLLRTLDLGENHIASIDNASFHDMAHLYGLRLTENNIEVIRRGTFDAMQSLHILNLSQNRLKTIEQSCFDNNTKLQAIRLDGNYLTEIAGLFTKLHNLLWLNISDNHLEVFDYALIPTGLQWLDVHANKIAELGNYFEIESQLSLSTIDASSNQLTEITGSAIPNSVELLYLNDNLISKVQSYTFFKKPNLTRVDLFGNKITTLDPNALRISAVPDERPLPEFYIGGNPYQCDCNLNWLQKSNADSRTQPRLMDLDSIYCKLLYNRGRTYVPLVEAMANQFLCKYETHCLALCHCCDFYACDCKMECPERCTCYHDQSWDSNVVDCSRAGYDGRLPDQMPMDSTQIYLDGNGFQSLASHAFLGRKRLKILFLNGSRVETISNRTFFGLKELEILQLDHNRIDKLNGFEFVGLENLKELFLQYNRISVIANNTFDQLHGMRVLRLDHNRIVEFNIWHLPKQLNEMRLAANSWSCECEFVERFREFLKTYDFVRDRYKIRCSIASNRLPSNGTISASDTTVDSYGENAPEGAVEGFTIIYNNSSSVCTGVVQLENVINGNLTSKKTVLTPQPVEGYIPLVVATLCAFSVVIVLTLVIFVFRQEVRVWFHSKFGVRLFYNTADLDKNERDRLFDAFISYSSKDESFVAEELAPVLENGDPSYKLCLHYRDFPVGAYIADNILQAVESSRRTIMVLSENFIKSEWCRFEFKSAHHQVLRDRRRRLIVILLGEVPQKDLDPDIRLYLKTNTYLQWGDKLFWEKLRFALPDALNNQRRQHQQNIALTHSNIRNSYQQTRAAPSNRTNNQLNVQQQLQHEGRPQPRSPDSHSSAAQQQQLQPLPGLVIGVQPQQLQSNQQQSQLRNSSSSDSSPRTVGTHI
ncbi:toll-like receptor Tollo [Anopheles ziemanni]|uniref:toll-like receptor Tollo n=1 Tax=Anopheles coustani TaxID=139045 RepID=UPI0026582D36|nr:toll-like receptor Tollo [Anopheles coustani]XP_058173672.1 toll-like receptor Tollo [Anopheles ziemanni]